MDKELMGKKVVIIISNIKYVKVTKDKEMIESYKARRNKIGEVGELDNNLKYIHEIGIGAKWKNWANN